MASKVSRIIIMLIRLRNQPNKPLNALCIDSFFIILFMSTFLSHESRFFSMNIHYTVYTALSALKRAGTWNGPSGVTQRQLLGGSSQQLWRGNSDPLSAPKTMRLLSGHILPRNASNFTCSNLDLKNFPRGRNPRPLLTGAGKGKRGED